MPILALETSARTASVAVLAEDRILASCMQDTGLNHSRTLMPLVASMLKNADLSVADMDAVAVAAGPGSFTGIRIGVSAVKGLAFAAQLPAVGVSTLEAMAWNLNGWDGLAVCAMDARRGQVYNAVFDVSGVVPRRLTPDRAIALTDLITELRDNPRRKIIVGDGALLCQQAFQESGLSCVLAPLHLRMQNACGVAQAAWPVFQRTGGVSAQMLSPVYLRPPYAIPLRDQKKRV